MAPIARRYPALFLIFFVPLSLAQSLPDLRQQGASAYKAGDVRLAIEKFDQAARLGDTKSMYNLAIIYERGSGVPPDISRAKDLLKAAAAAGDADAQFFLYQLLTRAGGAMEDQQDAIKWLTESAKRGLVSAQTTIGTAYRFGNSVPKDPLEAKKWFEAAATQGSAFAHVNLALMHSWRELGPQDLNQAYRYFRGAAMLGDTLGLISTIEFERDKRFAVNGLCIFLRIAPDTSDCYARSVDFLRQRISAMEETVIHTLTADAAAQFTQDRDSWNRGVSAKCSITALERLDSSSVSVATRQCIGKEMAVRVQFYLEAAARKFDGTGEVRSELDEQISNAIYEWNYRNVWKELKGVSSSSPRSKGKYYFEVVVNAERFAKSETRELNIFVGVTDGKSNYGNVMKINLMSPRSIQSVIGFVADLDARKYYRHIDGAWVERSPQQGNGFELSEAAGPLKARMSSDSLLADFLKDGALEINFGNHFFKFPPPPGYSGFERPGSFMPEHRLQP